MPLVLWFHITLGWPPELCTYLSTPYLFMCPWFHRPRVTWAWAKGHLPLPVAPKLCINGSELCHMTSNWGLILSPLSANSYPISSASFIWTVPEPWVKAKPEPSAPFMLWSHGCKVTEAPFPTFPNGHMPKV